MEQQKPEPQAFTSLENPLLSEWEITRANPSVLKLHRLPEFGLRF